MNQTTRPAPVTLAVLGLLAGGPATARAEELRLASVDEAIAHAQTHNPRLDEYALRQVQASRQYDAVRYHWLPTVSGGLSVQRYGALPVTPVPGELFGQPGTTLDAQFGKPYAYAARLAVSTSLLDVESRHRAEAAETAARGAVAGTAAYRQQLAEQVALNYYTAVATAELLRSQAEREADAAKLVALVESRFGQGVVDQAAVTRARIHRNTVLQNAASSRDVLEQAHANLRILLGLPAGTVLNLPERATGLADPMAGEALGPDRTLAVDALEVERTQLQMLERRASRWPKLDIEAYLGTQQLRDDFALSWSGRDWSETRYLLFTVTVPIFTGLSRRNQIRAAEAAHALAQRSYARRREEARIEDASHAARRELYREQVELTRRNDEMSKEVVTLALLKYEQGLIGLEQVLNAGEDQRRAEAAYLDALLGYCRLAATFISRRS